MDLLILAVDLLVIAYAIWMARMMLRARTVAPYVRTRGNAVEEIVETFGALPKGSVFYELGAGDGHVLVAVARANPEAVCIGIERDWVPYLFLQARIKLSGVKNVEARRCDMFNADLTNATHVYAYLYPRVLDALLPKLKTQLNGTLLVSLDFRFMDKEPLWERVLEGRHALGTRLIGYQF